MKYNNYENQQSLQKLDIEQLSNVLLQYGKTIDFNEIPDVNKPVLIASLNHGWVGNVTINSVGIDSNGVIELDAEDTEYGDAMDVDINEISYGFIGYITESVIDAAALEGIRLDPCVNPSKEDMDECLALSLAAQKAVSEYLDRHDKDGNLLFNDDNLVLYLGGMPIDVESVFLKDGHPALFCSSYEFEGSILVSSLNTANLRRINEYLSKH